MLLFHQELSRLWHLRLLLAYFRGTTFWSQSRTESRIYGLHPFVKPLESVGAQSVDIHCTLWMLGSLNGIRADTSWAQWLTVFYWVSLMHGTMESNNLQLRSHLSEGRNEQLWLMISVYEDIYTVGVIGPSKPHLTALLHSRSRGQLRSQVKASGHTGASLLDGG